MVLVGPILTPLRGYFIATILNPTAGAVGHTLPPLRGSLLPPPEYWEREQNVSPIARDCAAGVEPQWLAAAALLPSSGRSSHCSPKNPALTTPPGAVGLAGTFTSITA